MYVKLINVTLISPNNTVCSMPNLGNKNVSEFNNMRPKTIFL